MLNVHSVMAVRPPQKKQNKKTWENTTENLWQWWLKRTANHRVLRHMDGEVCSQVEWLIVPPLMALTNTSTDRCLLMGKVLPLVETKLTLLSLDTNGSSPLQSNHLVYESLHNCSWWSIPMPICRFSSQMQPSIHPSTFNFKPRWTLPRKSQQGGILIHNNDICRKCTIIYTCDAL